LKRDLRELREEIGAVDRAILRLVKKRLSVAQRIGAMKQKENLEIVDYEVEASVLERVERIARDEELNPCLARRLISTLIQEAVHVQSQLPKNRAGYLYSIFEKAEALESQGRKLIRLDVGEPDLAAPTEVKDALRDSLYSNDQVGYISSKGLGELREAIVGMLNERYGTDLEADQVLVTPGGKFAIFAGILAMISQGDRAVIPEPTWPVYGNVVRLVGGREDVLHTNFEEGWEVDLGKLSEMLRVRPRLLALCTPNNPTGKVFGEKELREMVEATEKAGGYVLTDEVYESYSTVPTKSILEVATSNFIYVNTFSKRYGMTGWRIGYAVSDRDTINRMQSIVQLSITCVPEFIQKAALAALTMEQGVFDDYAREMRRRMDIACGRLDQLPVEYIRPDGGMYVFPRARMEDFDSEAFAFRLLEDRGIVVTPGEAFGDYPRHFRVSLGTSEEGIREGIEGIGEGLLRWPKG